MRRLERLRVVGGVGRVGLVAWSASLPGYRWAGRGGWVGGTRRESRSAVRPSRWRLGVQSHARQCLASHAPSPLEAHVAPSMALMVPTTHPPRPAHGFKVVLGRAAGRSSVSQRASDAPDPGWGKAATHGVALHRIIAWEGQPRMARPYVGSLLGKSSHAWRGSTAFACAPTHCGWVGLGGLAGP